MQVSGRIAIGSAVVHYKDGDCRADIDTDDHQGYGTGTLVITGTPGEVGYGVDMLRVILSLSRRMGEADTLEIPGISDD